MESVLISFQKYNFKFNFSFSYKYTKTVDMRFD